MPIKENLFDVLSVLKDTSSTDAFLRLEFLNREIFCRADEISGGLTQRNGFAALMRLEQHLGSVSSRASNARGNIAFSNIMTAIVTAKAFMRKILQRSAHCAVYTSHDFANALLPIRNDNFVSNSHINSSFDVISLLYHSRQVNNYLSSTANIRDCILKKIDKLISWRVYFPRRDTDREGGGGNIWNEKIKREHKFSLREIFIRNEHGE